MMIPFTCQGERINPLLRCKTCKGLKVTRERKVLDVSIEKGMYDGQRITFPGEGDQKPGLERGDIVIVLEEKEHPLFVRKGVNLFTKMRLSMSEALTGLRRTLRTLDGRTLVVQTELGEVLRNGEVRCISREGMPTYRNPKRGKLIIQGHNSIEY